MDEGDNANVKIRYMLTNIIARGYTLEWDHWDGDLPIARSTNNLQSLLA